MNYNTIIGGYIMEENFNIRLQKAMNIRNIKAVELSEKTGIPKSSLSEYIKGKYEAKQKGIYKLAKVLNVSEGWLMGLDVPMERNFDKNIQGMDKKSESSAIVLVYGTIPARCPNGMHRRYYRYRRNSS